MNWRAAIGEISLERKGKSGACLAGGLEANKRALRPTEEVWDAPRLALRHDFHCDGRGGRRAAADDRTTLEPGMGDRRLHDRLRYPLVAYSLPQQGQALSHAMLDALRRDAQSSGQRQLLRAALTRGRKLRFVSPAGLESPGSRSHDAPFPRRPEQRAWTCNPRQPR